MILNKRAKIGILAVVAVVVIAGILVAWGISSGIQGSRGSGERVQGMNESAGFTPYQTFMGHTTLSSHVMISPLGYCMSASWIEMDNDTIRNTLFVASLYCANGTGHVYHGNNTGNYNGYVVFDFGGKWFMIFGIRITGGDVTPKLIDFIMHPTPPLYIQHIGA